jgi:hypothetical protein
LDGRIGRRHDEADALPISKSVRQDVNSQSMAPENYMHTDGVTSAPPGARRLACAAALLLVW